MPSKSLTNEDDYSVLIMNLKWHQLWISDESIFGDGCYFFLKHTNKLIIIGPVKIIFVKVYGSELSKDFVLHRPCLKSESLSRIRGANFIQPFTFCRFALNSQILSLFPLILRRNDFCHLNHCPNLSPTRQQNKNVAVQKINKKNK